MLRTPLFLTLALVFVAQSLIADDWPMWRYDAGRSAASNDQLSDGPLQLIRSQSLGARKPVWDDTLNRDLMTYDRVLEPIVYAGKLYMGLNDTDKLVAYDLATGELLWSYYCDGPVRLPPVAADGKIYCTSDDGFLHCVQANNGQLIWKFRGGPTPPSGAKPNDTSLTPLGRLSLGNNRLISAWPMRGGAVIRDGHLYFAASIWPFMGTFIYSLDAETGRVEWCNDETGAQYIRQPHSAPAFAGVAPQGALVATQDALIVPGGRSVPAVFARHTGELKYFELNAGGKGTGGSFVAANNKSWFVHTRERGTREFAVDTGLKTAFMPNEPVLAGDIIYAAHVEGDKQSLRAYNSDSKEVIWEFPARATGDLVKARQHLICAAADAADSTIEVLKLTSDKQPPKSVTKLSVPGHVQRLIVANGWIMAVTLEGQLHALTLTNSIAPLSPTQAVPKTANESSAKNGPAQERVRELLSAGDAQGYSVVLGAENEELISQLASHSPFVELSVFDGDATRVDRLRRTLDEQGQYGRTTVHASHLSELMLPPYLANMVLVSSQNTLQLAADAVLLAKIYESVRPYGGVLCLMTDDGDSVAKSVRQAKLAKAEVTLQSWGVVVRRVGALPGSSSWSHQYGDIANSIKSNDQLVKLPLGMLWYGGVSHEDVLPRHGHGPPEQVVGGRLVIEGIDTLTARDVYTGRVLWQREFKELGTHDVYFDDTYKETPLDSAYNQVHIPGANGRGTNYVVTDDRIYILEKSTCHVLDAVTGQSLSDIELPQTDPKNPNEWGYIGVYEDVLIGGVGFAKYRARDALADDSEAPASNKSGFGPRSLDRAASLSLIGFDRHTGKQLWQVPALHSFWHNGIVAGNGRIYVLDKNPKPVEEYLKRRGKANPKSYRIVALDVLTGEARWQQQGEVFGSWLGYSTEKDLLLQAGAAASDRLSSEVGQGMSVLNGTTGEIVWQKSNLKYSGPCVLHNDLVITNANAYTESAGAFYLADGSQKMTKNMLTGRFEPWKITRAYGCNSIVASENLLTFRSGAAGFYDMLTEAGTGNLGGFRSGCTSNLIAADGVLNAPDYTRTCSCSYQNQTSLALVHMPELDAWTISNSMVLNPRDGRLQQVGINLGAPGDRRAPDGQMWLEYPSVSGDSPNIPLEWNSTGKLFQDHPSSQPTATLPWVTSSGIEGLTELKIGLVAQSKHKLATGQPIEQSDDDAEESASGEVVLDKSGIELGSKKASAQVVGLRFNDLKLARGTKIRAASLQLSVKDKSEEECNLSLWVEDNALPAKFNKTVHNLSMRTRTKTAVKWTVTAWKTEGDAKADQRSPDISALISEVINRDDWQPGGSIAILISGVGTRGINTWKEGESTAAKLIIDADEVIADENLVEPLPYSVRLHFGLPRSVGSESRTFEFQVLGTDKQTVNLEGDAARSAMVTLPNVELRNSLQIKFFPGTGAPVISGVELERTGK